MLRFQKYLKDWYRLFKRDLPWRANPDPYHVWVSEVMLQQTQVRTVIPYYNRFLQRFPTLQQLAAADLDQVLKAWEGLGYYARARNLHKAAIIVAEKYDGILPEDEKELRRLPGIGEYIASAVLSIAMGRPHAVVDGNVKRMIARLRQMDTPVNKPDTNRVFFEIAQRLLAKKDAGDHNQAMMELGALICTPNSPDCGRCPVNGQCGAFLTDSVDAFPKKVQKSRVPLFHIATGVVCKGRNVLITHRKPEGLLGGLWEFPGGKILGGETPERACIREIKEEVNLDVEPIARIARIRHAYTHFKIVMHVFQCRFLGGRVRLNGPVGFRWIRLKDIRRYPLPGANHKFLGELNAKLKEYY